MTEEVSLEQESFSADTNSYFFDSAHVKMMLSPARPLCPSVWPGADLSPFLPSMLHCG